MERVAADQTAGGRELTVALLDFLRATVVDKADGISDIAGRRAPVPPSDMTVMGLVKHLTAVERWWFSVDFAAADVEPPWPDGEPFDGSSSRTTTRWRRSSRPTRRRSSPRTR